MKIDHRSHLFLVLFSSFLTPHNALPPSLHTHSYNPDTDPFGDDGSLWFFNYFFYNKKMKRIVFFKCRAFWYGVERLSELFNQLIDFLSSKTQYGRSGNGRRRSRKKVQFGGRFWRRKLWTLNSSDLSTWTDLFVCHPIFCGFFFSQIDSIFL